MVSLEKIQMLLFTHPRFRDSHFEKLEVKVMKKNKKDEYWGTGVKRFYKLTNRTEDTTEIWGIEGTIYLNMKDMDDKLLRVVAEEAAHLLDDGEELKEELYRYLEENITRQGKDEEF